VPVLLKPVLGIEMRVIFLCPYFCVAKKPARWSVSARATGKIYKIRRRVNKIHFVPARGKKRAITLRDNTKSQQTYAYGMYTADRNFCGFSA
jgi:hypothetical protein